MNKQAVKEMAAMDAGKGPIEQRTPAHERLLAGMQLPIGRDDLPER